MWIRVQTTMGLSAGAWFGIIILCILVVALVIAGIVQDGSVNRGMMQHGSVITVNGETVDDAVRMYAPHILQTPPKASAAIKANMSGFTMHKATERLSDASISDAESVVGGPPWNSDDDDALTHGAIFYEVDHTAATEAQAAAHAEEGGAVALSETRKKAIEARKRANQGRDVFKRAVEHAKKVIRKGGGGGGATRET